MMLNHREREERESGQHLKSNILRRLGEQLRKKKLDENVQQLYGDFAAVTSFLTLVLFLRMIILVCCVMQSQSYSMISTSA